MALQLHRRARALARCRTMLDGGDGAKRGVVAPIEVSSGSLVSVLLPLALHPLYETAAGGGGGGAKGGNHEHLLSEASDDVGQKDLDS